jgi:hypothetical protein
MIVPILGSINPRGLKMDSAEHPDRDATVVTFTINGEKFSARDAVRDGRQLLQMTGFIPPSDHVLIEITRPGAKVIGLDEELYLRSPDREEFWAFLSDREFNFTVDEVGYVWGAPTISEEMLRAITKTPADKELVLERKGGEDEVIKPGTNVDLATRGTEHIYTEARLITVYYADDPYELERGTYTGAKLMGIFPVPTGYVLDLVLPGEFKEIGPNDKVKLREGMHLVSHPPCGQSS